MRSALAVVAALAALAFAAPADGAVVFERSGAFAAGNPAAYALLDACTTTVGQEARASLDSACVALPGGLAGLRYTLTGRDATGSAFLRACFYSQTAFLGCPADYVVPAGAARAGVSALAGAQVQWTLRVLDA